MKKLLLALLVFTFTTVASYAQTTKPAQEKQKTHKKQPTAAPAAATAQPAAEHSKKDGTPDKRYKENKHMKKDGTADKRFKENKDKKQ